MTCGFYQYGNRHNKDIYSFYIHVRIFHASLLLLLRNFPLMNMRFLVLNHSLGENGCARLLGDCRDANFSTSAEEAFDHE
jgi:hypothetical protein